MGRLRIALCLVCWIFILPAAKSQTTARPLPPDKSFGLLRVLGADERELVTDTTVLPWSAVGPVESLWHRSDGVMVSFGTGTLIGSRVVLTGGHVVYDREAGWADEVIFIPGKHGNDEPFGRAYSVRTISQRAWVEQKDNRYDLAMIVLDRPLGEQTGYLPIVAQPESFFVDRNLNSAGYPGETKSGQLQYHSFGISMDVQDGLIRHTLDSEPGQSGSALWYYEPEGDDRGIVGVLTGSREINSGGQVIETFNVAVQINSAFAEWIGDTLASYDTVAENVAVNESAPAAEPGPCGLGTPAAALTALLALTLFVARCRLARR